MAKVTVSLSPYKVSNGLFKALFMGPKVEEEMVNARVPLVRGLLTQI